MKRLLIPLAAALVLIPLGLWWFSAEQTIKRRSNHLLNVITLPENSNRSFRQTKVYSLNSILSNKIQLSTPEIPESDGGYEKIQIENGFSWLCSNARQAIFTNRKFTLIDVKNDIARVEITVDAFVELPTHRPADGVYDITLEWRRNTNKQWLLDSATWKLAYPSSP